MPIPANLPCDSWYGVCLFPVGSGPEARCISLQLLPCLAWEALPGHWKPPLQRFFFFPVQGEPESASLHSEAEEVNPCLGPSMSERLGTGLKGPRASSLSLEERRGQRVIYSPEGPGKYMA